jgi:hydroxymethylpyrimidine/phosphomethylpyrimidine kinase
MATGRRIPRVLSIAGSDSGGGAGVQADLKAFAACGVHGMTAVTAITAQNTVGVIAVHPIPPNVIVAQVRAVVDDIGVDAVKVGMLTNVETIAAVAEALALLPGSVPVVIDPVMVAESGAVLLERAARIALIERLLPWATVLTPNLPEARALVYEAGGGGSRSGAALKSGAATESAAAPESGEQEEAEALVRAVHALGPSYIVLTGGHREVMTDLYFDGDTIVEIPGRRQPAGAAHGSGCTHSSVLTARLAWGDDPLSAARVAKEMAARAVGQGLRGIGAGSGPVDVLGIASIG